MHILHDIEAGKDDKINVIIEIPKGSKNKYEIDKKTGLIALDRVAHTSQDFPYDYGFVPQTHWHDGDPLDVIVLTTHSLFPGVLVRVRPVAIMDMVDGGDSDMKMIAVPCEDPRWDDVLDLKDLNKHTLREIEHFYSTYKKLQDKEVVIRDFHGKAHALKVFHESIALYKEKHKNDKK